MGKWAENNFGLQYSIEYGNFIEFAKKNHASSAETYSDIFVPFLYLVANIVGENYKINSKPDIIKGLSRFANIYIEWAEITFPGLIEDLVLKLRNLNSE